jgi:hypothetical protein
MVAIFVAVDLVPQLRDKDREKPAVWFAACVYALALAIDLMLGFGVQFDLEKAVFQVLQPLLHFLGGESS